jgi:serine protease AprX
MTDSTTFRLNGKRSTAVLRVVALGLLVAAAAGAAPAPAPEQDVVADAHSQVLTGYIVQAAALDVARDAVQAVGGEITHELGVIRAVGARLNESQLAALRQRPDVRGVFADTTVETACSTCASTVPQVLAGESLWDNDKFEWTLTNTSNSTVTLGSLTITWPSLNSTLNKVKLDGDEIWKVGALPPYKQIVSGWHDDVGRRRIAPGDTVLMKFEFDSDIDWTESNYTITADFLEGASVAFVPRVMDCRSNGLGARDFNGNVIKWRIPNDGVDPITVDELSVNWPYRNSDLVKVKLDGATLYEGSIKAPIVTLAEEWQSLDIRDRRILPGDERELRLEFISDVEAKEAKTGIIVNFQEGCRVEFAPTPGTEDLFGEDTKVDKKARDVHFVSEAQADAAHAAGLSGKNVTVAVLDTGIWGSGSAKNYLRKDVDGNHRLLRTYNAITDEEGDVKTVEDEHGHGTHIASIIASSRKARGEDGSYKWNGVAPGVNLVIVRAFDDAGQGTYMDVIRGIDWVVRNKDAYGIRVLNLSLSAPPRSHYWDDPLNQAVMEAWRQGIVVVASAGNTGPEPMTVGVPGNVPYVITVGAMTDNRTPDDESDDQITSFSATGPTVEGFVKPEMVAPGGRLLGMMNKSNRIPKEHTRFHDGDSYYYMSGTSQAAAVVSGVVALLLEAEPLLTPDQVKCKLMSSARPAVNPDGTLTFSIFRQGAGLVDTARALESTHYDCANIGLDIDADLAGTRHFGGRANQDEHGNYYLMGADGFLWKTASCGVTGS